MSKEQKLNKSFQEELKILKLDRDKMEKNEIEAALETSRKSLAANVLSSASQMELARKVFKDGRDVDLEGLKTCMTSGYSYIEGIEHLLLSLKRNNYEMHAFTNYPIC
ncbi:flavin mononucleotide hydrolase 1, chloroplatic-like [Arachis hypogaea]|uniref:flavin mononucleotide hydrolase 1, chloroplatic-like n=1 Tax=Arachis hypogaea TaxID=3818 RepID=UPI000DEDE804